LLVSAAFRYELEDWYLNVLAEASPEVDISVTPFKDRQGNPLTLRHRRRLGHSQGAKNPDAACRFAKTMTEASTWVAAAKARAEARAKKNLRFTGLYSGNKVADEQVFGEVYKPSGEAKFDDAVQTVLTVQEAAFATPPSPAGPSSRRPGRTRSTGSWPASWSRPRPWIGPRRPRPRSTRPRAGRRRWPPAPAAGPAA
jgi:hypothetical protein